MCNARNHPPGCNCGWGQGWQSGGYGSSGGRSSFSWAELNSSRETSSSSYSSAPASVISKSYKNTNVLSGSWVEPNSTCPVCGQGVYFYQSEHGGRIYFDELGPPWPKHVCTDNVEDGKKAYSGENRWDRQGWQSLQNFNVTITERDEGYLVRVQGEDESQKKRYFVCQIANNVEFDVFRFLPGKSVTTLSILARNKIGEFLVCEGDACLGGVYYLKIKESNGIIYAKEKSFGDHECSKFFRDWRSQESWVPVLNVGINSISGTLYELDGYEGLDKISFRIRLDCLYSVKYARFRKIDASSAVVSLLVENPEDKENYIVVEGVGSVGKSFPPGKKLVVKEVISKKQEKIIPIKNSSVVVDEKSQPDLLSEIRALDLEINDLLSKVSNLNREKTKLLEKFVGQEPLLD